MGNFLYSTFGFVVAIGILVTVHEFGHFWVARRVGVKVLRFSIGFGKPIFSRRGRNGETEYVIGLIPLGGYVKMLDENEAEVAPAEQPRAFNRQALWKRVAVVVAGPGFNFLFAIVASAAVFITGVDGIQPVVGVVAPGSLAGQAGIQPGDRLAAVDGRANPSWDENRLYVLDEALAGRTVVFTVQGKDGVERQVPIDLGRVDLAAMDTAVYELGLGMQGFIPDIPPVAGAVVADSPAAHAGIEPGDRFVRIDGKPVRTWSDVVRLVSARPAATVQFEIERAGQPLHLGVTPQAVTVDGRRVGRIGVERGPVTIPPVVRVTVRDAPLRGLWHGVQYTWDTSVLTVKMLAKMATGQIAADNISGPLTIAQYAGQSVQIGLNRFVMFLAVISISLGILNLLPIPLLDGGHLLYYLIEVVKGSPLSRTAMIWAQQIGIVMLAGLMSLAFYNDIVRLFG